MPDLTLAANNGDLGGGEVMLLRAAQAARELGRRVAVVGPDEPADLVDAAARHGFPTTVVRAPERRAYLRHLRAWDRAERRGVLWCHGLVPALATAGHPRRLVHLHQLPTGPAQNGAYRLARIRALGVLAPSDWLAARVPGTRSLPNWTSDVVRRHTRPSRPHLVVGFLGRRSPPKGLDVLARALLDIGDAGGRELRLLVAGDDHHVSPDERSRVRGALAGLDERTTVSGRTHRDDFFDQVDLAVFPSIVLESFGLVVAEAMAAGVPFVVSDAGALPEVAGPDHPWVARAGDVGDLARVIRAALSTDAETVTRVTDAAHDRWEREYSPAAGRRRVGELLDGLGI